MPLKKPPTRSSLRRKMVLPVTVIRRKGQEELQAHTLDLTEVSARLGGLSSLLQPGELIEIQRGGMKAKFQVFWMGTPGSAMEGQAGVRSVEPNKNIWGNIPSGEPDPAAAMAITRSDMQDVCTGAKVAGEKRSNTRFECTGRASTRADNSDFPVHGQVKDIAQGGVYVETTTPLTVNTQVCVKMDVEGIPIETAGVVRTSYPMVGMGISFQKISAANQEKVDDIIRGIRCKSQSIKGETEPAFSTPTPSNAATPVLKLEAYPVRVLVTALRALAADFDKRVSARSSNEIEELRRALLELQMKLSAPQVIDHPSSTVPQGGLI